MLKQLHELAELGAAFPWLKIAFSARPEAWRAIRRKANLPLPGLSEEEPGVEMIPFSRSELEQVYASYRRKFNLQSEFTDLAPLIRQVLRDPLQLKLVALTYHDRALPRHLPTSLYLEYINQLIREGRLREQDPAFLEVELLPLMITQAEPGNAIHASQINNAPPRAGVQIFELVISDEQLSNGQWVNQSFRNLVDAEILVRRGPPGDYEVSFKYERFYDYYGGRRLYKLAALQTDRLNLYLNLIQQTQSRPYLWGPVRNALSLEAILNGDQLLFQFCSINSRQVREMVVQVLNELGREESSEGRAWVENFLERLAPTGPVPNNWNSLVGLIIKKKKVSSEGLVGPTATNAYQIAIEVAGELGLSQILQRTCLAEDATIRTAGVRQVYFLWQRDRAAGFALVDYLTGHLKSNLVPDLRSFEAVFSLSLMIFSITSAKAKW